MNLSSSLPSALRLTVLAGACLLGAPHASHAATITWGAATTITGDGNILNTGTKVGAFNIGTTNVPSTTINGVTFDAFAPAPTGGTVGNFTLSGADLYASNTFYGAPAAPFTGLSANYQTLLQSGIDGNNAGNITLTMGGLTSGTNYSFQWWSNNSGSSAASNVTATSGNAVTLDPNTTRAGGVGQFVIGTFTADSASQVVTFSSANNYPTLNAFQLRNGVAPVPEPSTYAMMFLGVGALGLMTWKRKRSANPEADFAAAAI